jgi:hypothetical protein
MAKARVDIERGVLTLLNEATNSSVGDLASGTSAVPTITTSDTIAKMIDETAADLCRTCYLLPGAGSTGGYRAGQRTMQLHDLTARMDRSSAADGSVLWSVEEVRYNGAVLARAGKAYLSLGFGSLRTQGSPAYFYEDGEQQLGLFPVPLQDLKPLDAYGYVLPPSITVADLVWCPDDLARLIELRTAGMIAVKNFDDPTIFGRGAAYLAEYDKERVVLYGRIPESLRRIYYPNPPAPTLGAIAAPGDNS